MSYDAAVAAAIPGAPLRWKLDDAAGSTTALNSGAAGPSCNGTASSPAMAGAAGLLGSGKKAFRFVEASANAVSSAVAGNRINGLTSLALVLWFRYESPSGNDFLIDATNFDLVAGLSVRKSASNNVIANVQTSTGRALVSTPSNSITPNTRYCFALTWQAGSDVKLYLNGVRQTATIGVGTTINPGGTLVNPADLYLGKWKFSGVNTNYLQGWLDDITIGAAYLTDAQAVELYNQGIAEDRSGTGSVSAVSALLSGAGVKRGAGSTLLDVAPELAGAGRKAGAGTATLTARATGTATGVAERTARDITIDYGDPAVDFHAAAPSTASLGGGTVALYLPASTAEYVYVETTGAPADITANAPEVALVGVMADPTEADWHPAEWDPDRPTTIRYFMAGNGQGRYALWVRVADSPEVPVRIAGYVTLF